MEKKTETTCSAVGNNPNHKTRISGHWIVEEVH